MVKVVRSKRRDPGSNPAFVRIIFVSTSNGMKGTKKIWNVCAILSSEGTNKETKKLVRPEAHCKQIYLRSVTRVTK